MTFEMPVNKIKIAHEQSLRKIAESNKRHMAGGNPWNAEPLDVALAVERHRWAFRPAAPSVVLIAESHVFTTAEEVTSTVQVDALAEQFRSVPTEFVRFIYCLGYGENELLDKSVRDNMGTPGFWDIFGRLAETGALSDYATLAQRLAWKQLTLTMLQMKGIWLLDASVHAFYAPGGKRVRSALGRDLHRVWWTYYGHWLLEQLPPETKVWAVGKGVYNHLQSLGATVHNYVYQPRAARNKDIDMEHGWADLLGDVERGWKRGPFAGIITEFQSGRAS